MFVKAWPMFAFGLLGLLLGKMLAVVVGLQPSKFFVMFIICLGILGTLVGWKVSRKG